LQVGLIKKSQPYNSHRDVKYKFKLLYQSSRDSLDATIFHQKCDDIEKTLVVGKIQDSDQLVGGYNPLTWNGNKIFKETDKSFIFNIKNRNDINTAQFSYVINGKYKEAIYCDPNWLPDFGNSYHIHFKTDGSIHKEYHSVTYNNIDIIDGVRFDELEVFQVINIDN
jgi:hypothetical protein